MGYRDDQFYRIGTVEDHTTKTVMGQSVFVPTIPADNDSFIYPDNTVRTQNPDGSSHSVKLQRGFIRNLLTESNGVAVSPVKCQFQFNPAVLKQNVSMNTNLLTFFNQTASEMMQPVAAETSFGFELFFDRSMELNNPRASEKEGDANNPWATNSASQVGVLNDVSALYSVIGQGISESQRAYAKEAYGVNIDVEADRDSGSNPYMSDDDASETSVGPIDTTLAHDRKDDFVDNNMGNTAFLMPLPVRIIFSSLYMVEGYVNATDVVYSKFNSNMVPMQAVVGVTMKAMYIGFAKKDTWITKNLAEAAAQQRADAETKAQDRRNALTAVTRELSTIEVSTRQKLDTGSAKSLANLFDGHDAFVFTKPSKSPKDGHIANALASGSGLSSVGYRVNFECYGPFEKRSAIGPTGKPAAQDLPGSTGGGGILPAISFSTPVAAVTDKDEWNKLVEQGTKDPKYKVTKIDSSESNEKYFSYLFEINVTIVVDGVTYSGKGRWQTTAQNKAGTIYFPAWDDDIERGIAIDWEAAKAQAGDLGTFESTSAIDSTDTTTTPPPGSVSTVGGTRAPANRPV